MWLSTLSELYGFNAWANERIFDAISGLSDEQMNRAVEMGPGSIQATFWHNFIVERIWHERVNGSRVSEVEALGVDASISKMQVESKKLHEIRAEWMSSLTPADMSRMVAFKTRAGDAYTRRLSDILLHVVNHGVYHRSQIVNMIRQCGGPVPKPGADYIFMKWVQAPESQLPLGLAPIRRLYAYSDAMRRLVHEAAGALRDELLDRPFEMGLGSLRKTLVHLYDAEWWWNENWTKGGVRPFPKPDETLSVKEISSRFDEIVSTRNERLGRMTDADLTELVEVAPRPDLSRKFPIGVTMLQLCLHGTHHRAQANNMLRHLGAEPLKLDLVLWAND